MRTFNDQHEKTKFELQELRNKKEILEMEREKEKLRMEISSIRDDRKKSKHVKEKYRFKNSINSLDALNQAMVAFKKLDDLKEFFNRYKDFVKAGRPSKLMGGCVHNLLIETLESILETWNPYVSKEEGEKNDD